MQLNYFLILNASAMALFEFGMTPFILLDLTTRSFSHTSQNPLEPAKIQYF